MHNLIAVPAYQVTKIKMEVYCGFVRTDNHKVFVQQPNTIGNTIKSNLPFVCGTVIDATNVFVACITQLIYLLFVLGSSLLHLPNLSLGNE